MKGIKSAFHTRKASWSKWRNLDRPNLWNLSVQMHYCPMVNLWNIILDHLFRRWSKEPSVRRGPPLRRNFTPFIWTVVCRNFRPSKIMIVGNNFGPSKTTIEDCNFGLSKTAIEDSYFRQSQPMIVDRNLQIVNFCSKMVKNCRAEFVSGGIGNCAFWGWNG